MSFLTYYWMNFKSIIFIGVLMMVFELVSFVNCRDALLDELRDSPLFQKYHFDSNCSEVDQHRYLLYNESKALRSCAGLGHLTKAFTCFVNEAMLLRRTAILPDTLCSHYWHNGGVLLEPQPITNYFDFSRLGCVILWSEFVQRNSLPRATRFGDVSRLDQSTLAVLDMSNEQHRSIALQEVALSARFADAPIVYRANFVPPTYWWFPCDRLSSKAMRIALDRPSIIKQVALEIVESMKKEFVFVHVRRGDKAHFDKMLDRATSPRFIVQHLKACVPNDKYVVYIASDEFVPDYFNSIQTHNFTLFQARNFTGLLRRRLEAHVHEEQYVLANRQRRTFLKRIAKYKSGGHDATTVPVLLDNYLLFLVEQQIETYAAAVMCTETHRCPPSNPPTLFSSNNRKNPKPCMWSLAHDYTLAPEWFRKNAQNF